MPKKRKVNKTKFQEIMERKRMVEKKYLQAHSSGMSPAIVAQLRKMMNDIEFQLDEEMAMMEHENEKLEQSKKDNGENQEGYIV